MKVADVMLKDVHTVLPEEALDHAAEVMLRQDHGALPVVDGDERVIGMITDRDVCMCGLIEGRALNHLPVSQAMSRELWSCKPEDSLQTAQEVMRLHHLHRLPVLDGEGRLHGLLRLSDLLRVAADRRGPKATEVIETARAVTDRRTSASAKVGATTSSGEEPAV